MAEKRDIATCPSCSLQIKVIFDDDFISDFIRDNGFEDLVASF